MTLEFQSRLLQHIFQNKGAIAYKDTLDPTVFDVPIFGVVYSVWYDYVARYNTVPPKANFLEFTDKVVKRSKGRITSDVYNEIKNTIAVAYTQADYDLEFTREQIIEYARRKGMRNFFKEKADIIKNASIEDLDAMFMEMRRITRIGSEIDDDAMAGSLLFADSNRLSHNSTVHGHPTFLHGINKTTAAGGFRSPELILLMGGPKAFKTGTLLSIMLEYARSGLNVYIADFENGQQAMNTRLQQGLLECELQDVPQRRRELKEVIKRIKMYGGGDIYVKSFNGRMDTLDDVDADIEALSKERGFVPHVIMYDYLWLVRSSNKKLTEPRAQIDDVFHHAVRLNNKYKCFAWTPTKVKQEAVNKLVIKITDLGEAFNQSYNCHATFALCRTELEEQRGTGRIVSVVQRRGIAYTHSAATTCAIKITPATQTITELDAVAYMETLEEEYAKKPHAHKAGTRDLKDE